MTPDGRFEFGRVVRGYHPAQVDRCLQDLGEQLVRAEARVAELERRIEHPAALRHQPPHHTSARADALAALYTEVLALREEAARLVESARAEAAEIIEAARARAAQPPRADGPATARVAKGTNERTAAGPPDAAPAADRPSRAASGRKRTK